MMYRSIGLALACACLAPAPLAAATAAPSVADVQGAIQKTMPGTKLIWKSVQLARGRQASPGESAHAGMPYPVIVYPARVAYTSIMGFKRDTTWNYFIYKDDFGTWSATSNAIPGNLTSDPY